MRKFPQIITGFHPFHLLHGRLASTTIIADLLNKKIPFLKLVLSLFIHENDFKSSD